MYKFICDRCNNEGKPNRVIIFTKIQGEPRRKRADAEICDKCFNEFTNFIKLKQPKEQP